MERARRMVVWLMVVAATIVVVACNDDVPTSNDTSSNLSTALDYISGHHLTKVFSSVNDLEEVGTIPAPLGAHFLALTPDGTKLYAVVTSSAPDKVVSVFDTGTNTLLASIPLGIGVSLGFAIMPDGTRAYVAVEQRTIAGAVSRVEVIDIGANAIIATIPMPGNPVFGPAAVAITPDGSRVYVANRVPGRVDVISTITNTVITSIPLGSSVVATGIAITVDGSRAYVVDRGNNSGQSQIFVIEIATNTVAETIQLSGIGISRGFVFIATTPDGSRAYVTYQDSKIAVIDTDPASVTFNEQIDLISTSGSTLSGIAITSDGAFAFVTDYEVNDAIPDELIIVDIDPASSTFHTQLRAIPVGKGPFTVVIQDLPVAVAYVSNGEDGTISIIDIAVLEVQIDIKPESDPNSINPKSNGIIVVAVLTDEDFDATSVDVSTVAFGPDEAEPVHNGHIEDVDGDGDDDLVLHFKTQDTGIQCGDTNATLTGDTFDRKAIEGSDSVNTVECK